MNKILRYLKKASFGTMAFILAASLAVPAPALAAETKAETEASAQVDQDTSAQADQETVVHIGNHTTDRTDAMTVSDPVISDIQAPEAGKTLDEKALVTTSEGEKWQTPVLWIDGNLQIVSGIADKDMVYLPVIAYVVPEGYTFKDSDGAQNAYSIRLTEDVAKLFGNSRIITIYDRSTGITYILPASLKEVFADKGQDPDPDHTVVDQAASYDEDTGTVQVDDGDRGDRDDSDRDDDSLNDQEQKSSQEVDDKSTSGSEINDTPVGTVKADENETKEPEKPEEPEKTLVDIYCNEDAQNALSRDDLEFLTDLVVNKLQPQAINLLLKSFPAFKEAAEKGQIGKYLGLEIGYSPDSDSFGSANPGWLTEDNAFCYKMWINAASVVEDVKSDKPTLSREGKNIIELANTLVHESLHLFMFDYNRPGLTGMTSPEDEIRDKKGNYTDKYKEIHFPLWFIEGTASVVEHNWRGRYTALSILRMNEDRKYEDEFTSPTLLMRYINGYDEVKENGQKVPLLNYDLECWNGVGHNGEEVDTFASRYVSGYLATLYLCEMAAEKDPDIGSCIEMTENGPKFYSGNLRLGMNSILARMHKGESLDQVIADISGGRYANTDDFEKQYIKGLNSDGTYQGDAPSIDFTLKFMNYMRSIDTAEGRDNLANGSILFPLDQDFNIPLDPSRNDSSDYLKLIDWSGYVKSTASNTTTYQTGGKSVSGKGMNKEASADISAGDASDAPAASDVPAASGTDPYGLPAAAKEASPAEAGTADGTAAAASEDSAAVIVEGSDAAATEGSAVAEGATVADEGSAAMTSGNPSSVASEDSAVDNTVAEEASDASDSDGSSYDIPGENASSEVSDDTTAASAAAEKLDDNSIEEN